MPAAVAFNEMGGKWGYWRWRLYRKSPLVFVSWIRIKIKSTTPTPWPWDVNLGESITYSHFILSVLALGLTFFTHLRVYNHSKEDRKLSKWQLLPPLHLWVNIQSLCSHFYAAGADADTGWVVWGAVGVFTEETGKCILAVPCISHAILYLLPPIPMTPCYMRMWRSALGKREGNYLF